MEIKFSCQNCKKPLKARDDYVGRSIACPHCKESMKVPSAWAADNDEEALPGRAMTVALDMRGRSLKRESNSAQAPTKGRKAAPEKAAKPKGPSKLPWRNILTLGGLGLILLVFLLMFMMR